MARNRHIPVLVLMFMAVVQCLWTNANLTGWYSSLQHSGKGSSGVPGRYDSTHYPVGFVSTRTILEDPVGRGNTTHRPLYMDPPLHTVQWRIVVSGNAAYEPDFLNWYSMCSKVGFCPVTPKRDDETSLDDDDYESVRRPDVVLYAEDEAMYAKYKSSRLIEVKKAWEVGTKFNNASLTGEGRFVYANKQKFRTMMGRRPTIMLQELAIANQSRHDTRVLFLDLDAYMLRDPRPYFVGEYDFWGVDARVKRTGPYNGGIIAVRPTEATQRCMWLWKCVMEQSEELIANQKPLNTVIASMEDDMKHKMLNKSQFMVGFKFMFANMKTLNRSSLGDDVVIFHNNFCPPGCDKVERMKRFGLWHDDPSVNMYLD